MVPIFKATIKHGKVIFHNLELLNGYLISLENKEVEVIVRKKKKSRTNPQNAWYWSCVVTIPAEHFGYTPDEMHESFKFMFLKKQEGKKPLTVKSTTSLTTTEFSHYIEQCRQFCSEEGIYIPDPNEVELEPDKPIHEPTPKEVKDHQKQVEIEAKESKSKPVDNKTLDEIFGWVGKEGITEAKIMEISKDNFGKEPGSLTQEEAERLDSLIIVELTGA